MDKLQTTTKMIKKLKLNRKSVSVFVIIILSLSFLLFGCGSSPKTEPEKSKPSSSRKLTEKDMSIWQKFFKAWHKLYGPEKPNRASVEYKVTIWNRFPELSDRAEHIENEIRILHETLMKLTEKKNMGIPIDEQEFNRLNRKKEALVREERQLLDEIDNKKPQQITTYLPLVYFNGKRIVPFSGHHLKKFSEYKAYTPEIAIAKTEHGDMLAINVLRYFNEELGNYSPPVSRDFPYDLSTEFLLKPSAKTDTKKDIILTPVYVSWSGGGAVELELVIGIEAGFGYAGSSGLSFCPSKKQMESIDILPMYPVPGREPSKYCAVLRFQRSGWYNVVFSRNEYRAAH